MTYRLDLLFNKDLSVGFAIEAILLGGLVAIYAKNSRMEGAVVGGGQQRVRHYHTFQLPAGIFAQIWRKTTMGCTRASRARIMAGPFGARICGWNRRRIRISAFFGRRSRLRFPARRPGRWL